MKYFILTLLFLLSISPTAAVAQNDSTERILDRNSRALQFSVMNNFMLGSFAGSAISYKSHRSPYRANRFGLSFNNRYNSTDVPDDELNSEIYDMRINNGIEYIRIHYPAPENNVMAYYGYGPGLTVDYRKGFIEDDNQKRVNTDNRYGISVNILGGAEWLFHDSISLHAEYRTALSYSYRKQKTQTENKINDQEDIHKVINNGFSFQSSGVRFGLSVYF